MNPQQEASQYLTEKPPLNPVNSSLTPLEDPSKECNMHLLANAVDHVMYHPPGSATNENVETVVNIASGSDQQHGTTTTISRSSSTPFQSPAVLAPYKDNSLPTTSNTMNIAVGLISAHNYPSSVHPPSSSMPSSNYLPSGSSNTTPASVSSMHTISSSMPYTVMPSSIPLSSHIVPSASSLSYVSGSIRDSPTSSQHIVDTAASSVFSPSAGTIHRPTNSMPGISTMLQPSSSGLIKSSSSLTQKPVSVWPSGSSDPSVGAVSLAVSNIPLPTSGPLYTPLSSLQSNVMMSSSASQFQIASSSVSFEHKPNTTSPSISSMLGVSSSFESQPHMMEDASQSSSYSVSTSKKANLCTSDSSNHNIASISTVPHLSNSNARENRPTSSAPIHNSLHSTTGSQGYMKPNIFSQPSSTMLSQGEAAASCSSSLPESGQISSNPNNYLLNQSDSPSGPSSSEFSVVQVASSSLGRPSSALNNPPLLNTGKSDFSPSITTAADLRDTVSGSTDSPLRFHAEDQGKEAMNKRNSPGKKSVKCADTSTSSTDMGPDEVSPNRGQKRKRSQSPVSSSLAEPRRSRRQSKSKFNVLDLVGIGINIDYSLEDEKTPNKEVTKSSAVAADSSLTGDVKEELIVDVGDDEIYSNNSFDSNRRFKEKIDMEKIVAPFEQGWKREVVIRSVYEEFTKMGRPKRVPADVYYYAPDRRKLVSFFSFILNKQ
ncbi:unnamed protein product [Acanthosepion pharaonis]|uniref:MBD domain-containing protein n=1 Tax=Acanthosepion pharaonis TaxID=158019 RepID=A0A812BV50_ACAPH|nr:unnamed protein product [Sepia pharaonis]